MEAVSSSCSVATVPAGTAAPADRAVQARSAGRYSTAIGVVVARNSGPRPLFVDPKACRLMVAGRSRTVGLHYWDSATVAGLNQIPGLDLVPANVSGGGQEDHAAVLDSAREIL